MIIYVWEIVMSDHLNQIIGTLNNQKVTQAHLKDA